MPARYRIYPEAAFVHTESEGVLTGAEMIAHAEALARDPVFAPSFAQLADFRAVTQFSARGPEMRRLAAANPFATNARRVGLVGSDVSYGMLRMYQMMTDTEESGTLVTRDEAEAWAHIGRRPDILHMPAASSWHSSAGALHEPE
jgi:hypothetical protein